MNVTLCVRNSKPPVLSHDGHSTHQISDGAYRLRWRHHHVHKLVLLGQAMTLLTEAQAMERAHGHEYRCRGDKQLRELARENPCYWEPNR